MCTGSAWLLLLLPVSYPLARQPVTRGGTWVSVRSFLFFPEVVGGTEEGEEKEPECEDAEIGRLSLPSQGQECCGL